MDPETQTQANAAPSRVFNVLDETLTKDDAMGIVRRLLEIRSKTKTLGRLLLREAVLDLTPQQSTDSEAALLYIVEEFLKQVKPKPTWRAILNALRDQHIKEHRLAQEIEESLTTTPSCLTLGESTLMIYCKKCIELH